MLPAPNMQTYNDQMGAIQAQIARLQQQQVQPMPAAVPQVMPMQSIVQIKYVDGIGGAKEYQAGMPNNSSEILMDKNDDIFYVVSKDANGVSPKSMPIGRFVLEQEQDDTPQYVTKRDFDDFEKRIIGILSSVNTQASSVPMQSSSAKAQEVNHE